MNKFVVPDVPTIFVPVNNCENSNKSERKKSSQQFNPNKISTKVTNNVAKVEDEDNSNKNCEKKTDLLCNDCSKVLVNYLKPVQEYINKVMEIVEYGKVEEVIRQEDKTKMIEPLLASQQNVISEMVSSSQVLALQSNNFKINLEKNLKLIANDSNKNESAINSNNFFADSEKIPSLEVEGIEEKFHLEMNKEDNLSVDDMPSYQCKHDEVLNQGLENELKSKNLASNTYEALEDSKSKGHILKNETQNVNNLKDKVLEKQECEVLHDKSINEFNVQIKNKDKNVYIQQERLDSTKLINSEMQEINDNKRKPLLSKDSFAEIDRIKTKIKNGQVNQPYAYVTIAYNNLTACNAIILANSLMFNNNKIIYTNDEKNQKINSLYIPTVILLPGKVDPLLRSAINMIFDEVITDVSDIRTSILKDRTLDIHEYKWHLWKLLIKYDKCLFLESSLLIVGVISDLFVHYNELSACVDVLFPDFFDCSLFLFEPSLVTYEDLVHFLVDLDSKKSRFGYNEGIDEITLLNTYFAKRWNKLSCVYNYVYNDSIYTQIPAYLRYGDAIRIINFGQMSISSLSINVKGIAPQPWHVIFDLLQSSASGKVITKSPVNNYTLFYLTLFVKRLWPLLRKDIEPLLIDSFSYGGKDWSIFELIRVLSQRFNEEYENHLFNQQPNSFRRKKISNAGIYELIEENKIKDNLSFSLSLTNSSNKEENHLEITKISDKGEDSIDNVENIASSGSDGIYAWESGQIDWMGAHQSDKIIANLKNKIQ